MKKLYLNSCSYMDNDRIISPSSPLVKYFSKSESRINSLGGSSNELIFRRSLLDILNNDFDFVIICWSHPERFIIPNLITEIDYNKLKEDGNLILQSKHYTAPYGYRGGVPGHLGKNNEIQELLKFEPKGTDDTILYTISLHELLKLKNIPHLFLNMGKLDENVLEAREGWVKHINPINYLSMNDDDNLLEKMKFSFVEYFVKKGGTQFIKDRETWLMNMEHKVDFNMQIPHTNPYLVDLSGHLSEISFNIVYKRIYDYIIKNNLI